MRECDNGKIHISSNFILFLQRVRTKSNTLRDVKIEMPVLFEIYIHVRISCGLLYLQHSGDKIESPQLSVKIGEY